MRISDWSSDVCSSDLKLDGHRQVHRMIQHGYKHRRIGCGLDFRVSECRIFLESPGGKHADHLCLAVDDILFDKLGGVVTEVAGRSEEHTSELQSLMRISYAVFCLKKKNTSKN